MKDDEANAEPLRCFERRLRRKIFGPLNNQNTNQYHDHNIEIRKLFGDSDIVKEIKEHDRQIGRSRIQRLKMMIGKINLETPTVKKLYGNVARDAA